MGESQNHPLTIRGVVYSSQAAAARALGLTPGAISLAKRRGRLEDAGLGNTIPVPIRIRGKDYPSVSAAARALKLSRSTITSALERGALEGVGLMKERGLR